MARAVRYGRLLLNFDVIMVRFAPVCNEFATEKKEFAATIELFVTPLVEGFCRDPESHRRLKEIRGLLRNESDARSAVSEQQQTRLIIET